MVFSYEVITVSVLMYWDEIVLYLNFDTFLKRSKIRLYYIIFDLIKYKSDINQAYLDETFRNFSGFKFYRIGNRNCDHSFRKKSYI